MTWLLTLIIWWSWHSWFSSLDYLTLYRSCKERLDFDPSRWLTVNLTVLIFGSQVITVILAGFFFSPWKWPNYHIHQQLQHWRNAYFSWGRIKQGIEWDKWGSNWTRNENPADVLRLSEPDSLSYEVFSSDNMIQLKGASPVLRQKRSPLCPCYTGNFETVTLASGGPKAFLICRKIAVTGCASSISSNQQNRRLCVASLTTVLVRGDDGTNYLGAFAQSCLCAAWNNASWL